MNHQPKRNLPERGLSLLCAVVMVTSMVLGNLDVADVSASEQMLICSVSEHTHGEGCYQNQLTCGQNEHGHGDDCYNENQELICGQNEHTHSESCYTKVLVCGQGEHTHGGGCYAVQETQPQTAAETIPETTQTETVKESQPQTETAQTLSETSDSTLPDTILDETQTSSGQETADPSSESPESERTTESETMTESETKKAEELRSSVSTKAKYAVAEKDDLVFNTKISGGTEPYTVKYEIKLEGKTVYEQKKFADTVTYQPKSYGVHTLYMEVTDAAGQTSKDGCSIPVAVNETENSGIWQQSVQNVTVTGDYAKDIVAIAKTQIGNKENKKNFIINKEGKTQYYSRYGQWYGHTYEEWSAMFVSFCAAYAGIPETYLPREKDNSRWLEKLGSRYVGRDGYTPQAGDFVFFSENPHKDGTSQLQSGSPAHVGIVIDVDAQNIYTIEGNAGGTVSRQQYGLGEVRITGYMRMEKVMELAGKLTEEETSVENEKETETETETEIETETETEIETETETEAEIENETEIENEIETEAEIESETEIENETETEAETESEIESETESEIETESETELIATETIEITADDVILRAQPSVEADVVGVVSSGTELELLDTVEAEDAAWYKVNYHGEGVRMQEMNTEDTQVPAEDSVQEDIAAWADENPGVEAYVRSDLADVLKETEAAPEVMTYEDDEVIINVTEVTEGAIPENAILKVVPLKKGNASTAAQYAEVEAKLQEKAENEEYDIAGFLAYDITFVDENGEKLEPNGEVKVSMDYKAPVIPTEVVKAVSESNGQGSGKGEKIASREATENDLIALIREKHNLGDETQIMIDEAAGEYKLSPDWLNYPLSGLGRAASSTEETQQDQEAGAAPVVQITVMHLEENKDGVVENVVDMNDSGQLTLIDTTGENEVQKTEFVTDGFSAYTITWQSRNREYKAVVHASYGYLENGQYTEFIDTEGLHQIKTITTNDSEVCDLSEYSNQERYEHDGEYEYVKVAVSTDSKYSTNAKDASHLKYDKDEKEISYSSNGRTYRRLIGLDDNKTRNIYVYYIYQKKTTIDPGPGPTPPPTPVVPQLGEPDHHKTIAKNEDGTYTIRLDVTGMQFPPDPIDVLLVIDRSGSMGDDDRYDNVNKAIESLQNELKKAVSEVNVAAITFSGAHNGWINGESSKPDAWLYSSWMNNTNFSFELVNWGDGKEHYGTSNNCCGGTNWQAGIRLAEETLTNRIASNPKSKKIVVFLTDGEPTYYYDADGHTAGTGQSGSTVTSYNNAVSELRGTTYLRNSNYVTSYVVDATGGNQRCKDITAEFGNGTYLQGNNPAQLQETFGRIASDLLNPAYTEVVITDVLSQYVQFAETTPSIEVWAYMVDDYGTATGEETLLIEGEDKDYTKTIDTESKKITVSILNGQKLENKVRYLVKFDVMPVTEECLKANGFNAEGEEGTDAGGWYSNSEYGNRGFYSNDNDNTYVEYCENDNEKQQTLYQKPIIQFDIVSRTVNKVWEDDAETHEGITVSLKATVGNDQSTVLPRLTAELNETDGWTYTWTTLPKYYYSYGEDGRAKREKINYTIEEITQVDGYTAEYQTDGNVTTITNKLEGELKVSKCWVETGDETVDHSGDAIYVGLLDASGALVEDSIRELNVSVGWETIYSALGPIGEYQVKELIKLDGLEDGAFEVEREGVTEFYRPVSAGEVVIVGDYYYRVGYEISHDADSDNKANITITNTLNWQIVKRSSSEGNPVLKGAEFELQQNGKSVYQGVSGDDGVVAWNNNATIADGIYTLAETKAPTGYTLGENVEITITNGLPVISETGIATEFKDGKFTIYYDDDVLYSLPSTGGRGIYWYLIGGMLLMMAASLIVYKNKCKEVLKS